MLSCIQAPVGGMTINVSLKVLVVGVSLQQDKNYFTAPPKKKLLSPLEPIINKDNLYVIIQPNI